MGKLTRKNAVVAPSPPPKRAPVQWLPDDGIIDEGAVNIVLRGDRPNSPPKLTRREALLAVDALARKNVPSEEISKRVGVSPRVAHKWATKARKGELVTW
jgi:hypothetical protein